MRSSARLSPLAGALRSGVLAVTMLAIAQTSRSATLWTGPNTNFTQSASSLTDVLIPGAVSLTRAYSQWLFNPAAGDAGPGTNTPTDTEWAFGGIANYAALDYQSFDSLRSGASGDLSSLLVGNPMVLHLINEDIYLSLTFSAWPQGGGFFVYTRSTPAAAVTITNPANGAVFAAPANVTIAAAATVAGATVTNVAFLSNTDTLGVAQTAPFTITTGSLGAGFYALSAVATAAGVSVTSSVVNITVVSPAALTVTSPKITSGQFAFDYAANAGLRYVVQNSSNLVDWVTLSTNAASTNLVHITDIFIPTAARYYRVGRLPNP